MSLCKEHYAPVDWTRYIDAHDEFNTPVSLTVPHISSQTTPNTFAIPQFFTEQHSKNLFTCNWQLLLCTTLIPWIIQVEDVSDVSSFYKLQKQSIKVPVGPSPKDTCVGSLSS